MGCAFSKRRPVSSDIPETAASSPSHSVCAPLPSSIQHHSKSIVGKLPVFNSIFNTVTRYQKQTNTYEYHKHQTRETKKVRHGRDTEGNKTLNQYIFMKPLGSGAYGKVQLYFNAEDNNCYAIKSMKKKHLLKRRFGLKKSTAWDDVMREIGIMKRLDHKNIIKLYEVMNDPTDDKLYLVLEYAEGGPIQKAEMETDPVPEQKLRKYFLDVVKGLEYLHNHGVIHRDIKPENLLIGANDTIKIADFGVSYLIDPTSCHETEGDEEALKKTVGSPAFLAPELCASETFKISGPAIDIWSLGVTLYFFVFGRIPFTGETEALMYENVRTQDVPFSHPIDKNLADLLKRLLTKDPDHRITIGEILVHPWVTVVASSKKQQQQQQQQQQQSSML